MSSSQEFLEGRESSFTAAALGDFIPKTEFSVQMSEIPDSLDLGDRRGREIIQEHIGCWLCVSAIFFFILSVICSICFPCLHVELTPIRADKRRISK